MDDNETPANKMLQGEETYADRVIRLRTGQWTVFRGTGAEPVYRVTGRFAESDGRRWTTFVALDEVAAILSTR